jgi:hypothetical protein
MSRTLLSTLAVALATLAAIGAAPASAAPVPAPVASATSAPAALCPPAPGRMRCLSERVPVTPPRSVRSAVSGPVPFAARPAAQSGSGPYGPADLRAAYDVPDSTTTATVGIVVAYDAPRVEADLSTYRAAFGLPRCTTANGCFRKVNQDGDPAPLPAPNADWAAEATLDVSMVSAICPSCHILLVEADDDNRSGQPNLQHAIQTAVALGAHYVSMSWGAPEGPGESSSDARYLSAPGVTYVASAGDSGYATSWPAASPLVVSVGGTTLDRTPKTSRGWTETVWSNGAASGTGSGCSPYEPRPAWQDLPALAGVCAGRALNDVAAVADPGTGVYVAQGSNWYAYGGTSVGAPIIAAMEAIAGTAGGAPAYPYSHPGGFHDVTSGATASCGSVLCRAGPGWDGPTGVGTPDGVAGLGPPPPTDTPGSGPTWDPNSPAPGQAGSRALALRQPSSTSSYARARMVIDVRATGTGAGSGISYRATGLPAGTAVHHTGFITGRPRRAGTYHVSVVATDAAGESGRIRFTWRVRAHRIVPSATPHTAGRIGTGRTVRAVWGTFRQDTRRGRRIHPRVRVQWFVDGHRIRGADRGRLTIPARYARHRISFTVTATANGYTRYTHATAPSARVR